MVGLLQSPGNCGVYRDAMCVAMRYGLDNEASIGTLLVEGIGV